MSMKMTIAEFEDALEGLQSAVVIYPEDGELDTLFDITFPRIRRCLSELSPKLSKIGMFDKVASGLDEIERLARDMQYREGQRCVSRLLRELSEASGTAEALRKKYPPRH
jgi:hypothetical protein